MKELVDLRNNIVEIHENPKLDEIWDLCVRNFLYDQEKYVGEIIKIFNKLGITKKSRIADVSAGGGFPAINLAKLGYGIDCFDGFASDLFNRNADSNGVDIRCQKKLWAEIPQSVPNESYDFVFCRGNSFIFAGGGWEDKKEVDRKKAISDYQRTVEIFANMLKQGGYMYIDKFKDSEKGHREKLTTMLVGGQPQDIVFSSERFPEQKIRQVFMDRIVDGEIVKRENRTTYDLTEDELVPIVQKAGFVEVKKISVAEEKNFDVWLAKK